MFHKPISHSPDNKLHVYVKVPCMSLAPLTLPNKILKESAIYVLLGYMRK